MTVKAVVLFLLFSALTFAAIPGNAVWEVRLTGSDTNGGGWVPASSGTDYSQQSTAQYALTNGGATTGSATITTTSAAADMVGNLAYVAGGTGSMAAGWYEIISAVVGTSVTLDRSTGVVTGTGVTINVGGALVSPGQASLSAVTGNAIFVQNTGADGNTVYLIGTGTGSGNEMNSAAYVTYQGYTTNRTLGNSDPRPRFKANAASVTITGSSTQAFSGIYFDGNSQTTVKATAGGNFIRCYFTAFNTASTGTNTFTTSESTVNSAVVLSGACTFCVAHGNTATGIQTGSSGQSILNSLSYGNTGASSHGFNLGNAQAVLINDVAYNNGGNGFNQPGVTTAILINCESEGHAAGKGYALLYNTALVDSSTYNNNSANTLSTGISVLGPSLTTSPFTSASTGDFSLNATSGGGAALRAAGFPALFPAGLTANYRDIGAAQHQDSGGAPTQKAFGSNQ